MHSAIGGVVKLSNIQQWWMYVALLDIVSGGIEQVSVWKGIFFQTSTGCLCLYIWKVNEIIQML